VGLLKEFYGRGPVKTRTYLQSDVVLVVMQGGFSKVEHTLLESGRGQAVRDQRESFQSAMRPQFVAAIEEETGRKVISFMSANDQDADAMAEIFLLEGFADG
jgi:uncharacterized protein YbcI